MRVLAPQARLPPPLPDPVPLLQPREEASDLVSAKHHEAVLGGKEKRPGPLTCRDSGRHLCARGDLNPHALSDTGT